MSRFNTDDVHKYFGATVDTTMEFALVDLNSIPDSEFHIKDLNVWVGALRSGSYFQAEGSLRTDEGFCCLGVYADCVYHPKWEMKKDVWGFNVPEYDRAEYMVPTSYLPRSLQYVLSRLNDKGASFEQIAYFLESECVEA